MKYISSIIVVTISALSLNAQGNSVTKNFIVYGNCNMCKSNIEKAALAKNTSAAKWDAEKQIATITYNTDKINADDVLKNIALAGYDNEKFLAPDDVYAKLPACCKYDRKQKSAIIDATVKDENAIYAVAPSPLQKVYDHYFLLKDALVKTNAGDAANHAAALSKAINAVSMKSLAGKVHDAWMKVYKGVDADAKAIASAKDIAKQRTHFMHLSQKIYSLVKESGNNTTVYRQHCPMANDNKGAYWLSKEQAVKNPYYGSQMLTCGKTVETLE